jgi:hypothetical protein
MRTALAVIVALVVSGGLLPAQETKAVPKDSVRVHIPGCAKGYVFTAGPRTSDEPGSSEIPEGMHLRMNGPKKLMNEIKTHQGSMIEITGLMKKGQFKEGIGIGGGVRIMPGSSAAGGMGPRPAAGHPEIDVEGWRPVAGFCRSQ